MSSSRSKRDDMRFERRRPWYKEHREEMARAALNADEIASFRTKVIRAATRLFAEQGFQAVTMRAIADEVGTSAMAPYRYFKNKAEIFALVRAEATRAFYKQQVAAIEAGGSTLERLIRAGQAYVRFALDHPDQYGIIFEQRHLVDEDEEYPELREANRTGIDMMLGFGHMAAESGLSVRDPITLAHMMWALVHGLVSLHFAGKLKAGRSLEQLLADIAAGVMEFAAASQPSAAARAATPKAAAQQPPRTQRKTTRRSARSRART